MADANDDLQLMPAAPGAAARADLVCVQAGGYLLELSLDWIIRRASANAQQFLGHSHVAVIDEPLGRFVQAQALHDLRNLFSRLSGTTGIARAYRVRLTQDQDRFDIAFQLIVAASWSRRCRARINGSDRRLVPSAGWPRGLPGLTGRRCSTPPRGECARSPALTV